VNYLIDSNIIIYSCIPDYTFITDFILENLPLTSIISKIEVLGYNKLATKDLTKIEALFSILNTLWAFRRCCIQSNRTSKKLQA